MCHLLAVFLDSHILVPRSPVSTHMTCFLKVTVLLYQVMVMPVQALLFLMRLELLENRDQLLVLNRCLMNE